MIFLQSCLNFAYENELNTDKKWMNMRISDKLQLTSAIDENMNIALKCHCLVQSVICCLRDFSFQTYKLT